MKLEVNHHHSMGVWKHRYALWNLIKKDFRVRYRNMALGFLWSVINPLVMLSVLVFVFTYVLKLEREPFYPVVLLVGLVLFNFFSLCMTSAASSIPDNGQIVKKIIFPRIIIPLSVVFSQMIHLFLSFGVVAIFILVMKVPLHDEIIWLPLIVFVLTLFIVGASFLASALNVYFRDVRYIIESAMAVLFWLTPIFYPLSTARDNLPTYLYIAAVTNPLAGCIGSARNVLIRGLPPDFLSLGIAAVVAVLTLIVGYVVFYRLQNNFADKI